MSDKEADSRSRFDQRLLVVLDGASQDDDEIDLGAYWRIIRGRKWLILIVALVAAMLSVGLTLRMHNTYRAQVLLAPVGSTVSHGRGRLASALRSFRGLASMTGMSMNDSSVAENLAVLKSRLFLTGFIRDNKLMPILFARRWDAASKTWKGRNPGKRPNPRIAYRLFSKGVIHVKTDKDSGLITLSVIWRDPKLAADWANKLVARLNDYLRLQAVARREARLKYLKQELQATTQDDMRQALIDLIMMEQKKVMIADTQKQFAFRVLDPAVPPFRKFGPHRARIVLVVTFAAGFLAIVYVLLREMIAGRQEAPESQE